MSSFKISTTKLLTTGGVAKVRYSEDNSSPPPAVQGGLYFVGSEVSAAGGFGTNYQNKDEWTRSGGDLWKHAAISDLSGYKYGLYIRSDNTLWVAGQNNYAGQLGTGNTNDTNIFVQVSGNWLDVTTGGYAYGGAHSYGIKTDGTLWAWGNTVFGNFGGTPTQIGSDTDWIAVSAGAALLALKSNGTLYAAGYNGNGAVGDGTTTNRSSLVAVDSAHTFASISAGPDGSAAIRSNGELYTWGYRNGINNGSITSPTKLGSDTWLSCTMYDNGGVALKSDGSVWGWGTVPRYGFDSTPSQRSAGPYTWLTGSSNNYMTIKSDGTLWLLTQQGIRNYDSNTWLQTGSDTNWKKVWIPKTGNSWATAIGAS